MSLVVEGLTKYYGNNKVVDNVSFKVLKGRVYGLLGRNGSGKTTTIRMILNIVSKDSGKVRFNGKQLNIFKSRVGYLPEERGLYQKAKVFDQLMYFGYLSGLNSRVIKQKIKYWAERFEIIDYLDKVLDTLSKGNQQKVQIISSIINDPDIIIFDEPFSGLDPVNSEIFRNVVIEFIKQGKYILLSSHQMFYVEEFCDSISILKKGKQEIFGSVLDIKKNYKRTKLVLEIEGNLPDLRIYGIKNIRKTKNKYEITIVNENIAEHIISILFRENVKIFKFNLEYKSLHDIFLETVGD